MDPMEVFKIEVTGQEEYGAKKYRELIMDILQDLGLIRSIGRLYVYVDILKPFFAVYGLLRSGIPPLTAKDVGDVMRVSGGYQIKINDEEHMADLLRAAGVPRAAGHHDALGQGRSRQNRLCTRRVEQGIDRPPPAGLLPHPRDHRGGVQSEPRHSDRPNSRSRRCGSGPASAAAERCSPC